MYVSKSFKEGIIYSSKKGTIYSRISFGVTTQDLKIYEALKEIASVIVDPYVSIKINYTQDKILDKQPESPSSGDLGNIGDVVSETIITVPKFKYILDNIIYTDEEIYGKNLDGENREYRLFWKDEKGAEYPVPLKDFDNFEAKNPNKEYSYNSETHELSFGTFIDEDTDYIVRRYRVE